MALIAIGIAVKLAFQNLDPSPPTYVGRQVVNLDLPLDASLTILTPCKPRSRARP